MTKYPNSECEAHRNVETSKPVCVICMGNEIEQLRVQLAGCGVAAMCNTVQSREQQKCVEGDYGWSQSYQDVVNAVGREIELREAITYINKLCEGQQDFLAKTIRGVCETALATSR